MRVTVELDVLDANHNAILFDDIDRVIKQFIYNEGRVSYYDRSLNKMIELNISVHDIYQS